MRKGIRSQVTMLIVSILIRETVEFRSCWSPAQPAMLTVLLTLRPIGYSHPSHSCLLSTVQECQSHSTSNIHCARPNELRSRAVFVALQYLATAAIGEACLIKR
jgi:hypothetical protein